MSAHPLLKKKTKNSKASVLPFLSSPSLSATLFTPSWFLSPSWTERSAMCKVSQQDHRKRQAPGWVLAAFIARAKPRLYDEWPVKGRWQSDTHTTYSRRQAHQNLSALMYQNSGGIKSRNIWEKVIQGYPRLLDTVGVATVAPLALNKHLF